MSGALHDLAHELREAFDRSFAEPALRSHEPPVELLEVRVAGKPIVVRLGDLESLHPAPTIVPLAGASASLLGLAGVRGRIVPVWSLERLLGEPDDPAGIRWLALLPGGEPVALALGGGVAQRRAPRAALARSEDAGLLAGIANLEDGGRPVLRIDAVLAAIRRTAGVERSG